MFEILGIVWAYSPGPGRQDQGDWRLSLGLIVIEIIATGTVLALALGW